MPSLSQIGRKTAFGALAAAFALSVDAPALAQAVEMDLEVTSGGQPVFSDTFDLPQVFNFGSLYQFDPEFAPELAGQDFTIQGPVTADNDINSITGLLLSTSMNIVNNSDQDLEFLITLNWGVSSNGSAVDWTTNSTWNFGGPPGAQFSSLPGMHLWSAGIDGTIVGQLHPDPQSMSQSDGLVIPSTSVFGSYGAGVVSTMSVTLAFEITPNADAGVNGVYAIVPAPGALAVLGLGLLAGRRRRR